MTIKRKYRSSPVVIDLTISTDNEENVFSSDDEYVDELVYHEATEEEGRGKCVEEEHEGVEGGNDVVAVKKEKHSIKEGAQNEKDEEEKTSDTDSDQNNIDNIVSANSTLAGNVTTPRSPEFDSSDDDDLYCNDSDED